MASHGDPVGVWADNRERLLAATETLPRLPWAVCLILDQDGRDSGFAVVRGRIREKDRSTFDEVASSHRLIGSMEWWGFPRPEVSWGAEMYEFSPADEVPDPFDLPEIGCCEAWTHCARDPSRFLPPDRPRFLVSNSDFVDPEAVWEAGLGSDPNPLVPKVWDVVCAYRGHWSEELPANWSLARRCIEILSEQFNLSVLVISRGPIPDVASLGDVETRAGLSWSERMGCVARSRVALFPGRMDPSPRLITQSLCLDVPVLLHSGILGGWKYVEPETGRFFDNETDVGFEAMSCISGHHSPREWITRNYGPDRAARRLADALRSLGGAEHLRYAFPSTVLQ